MKELCVWCKSENVKRMYSASANPFSTASSVRINVNRCLDCEAAGRATLSSPMFPNHYKKE